jgi:hypothetical protein
MQAVAVGAAGSGRSTVAREQLTKAAVRLADVLNAIAWKETG